MLEARKIHKVYNHNDKAIQVLKGVDLAIEDAKFVAIVGPSGAGKSTLLHILGGLDCPTQGEVILDNKDIYRLSDFSLCQIRNKKIGFVFQFYHLLSEFTVLENVLMPALIGPGITTAERQKIDKDAHELLDKIGLGERTTHFPSELSGGEQQRVAIARALINGPGILFCDEPTGNLDSKTGSEIISLLKWLNLENRMTVVLVTHNLEIAKTTDEVYHLRDGVLVS